jgi:ferredoxin-type protein NapH
LSLSAAGFITPSVFLLLGCMAGALGIAAYKGRAWCDWMCPRGSFYDFFLHRQSKKHRIPAFFHATGTRIAVITLLFAVLGTQIFFAWPSSDGMGRAFVIVLTITTSIGAVLGVAVHPRTWCHISPMGTLANWLSDGKKPLRISEACVSCKVCDKICPMQLAPSLDKERSMVVDNDCIKCGTCVVACPTKSLSFER